MTHNPFSKTSHTDAADRQCDLAELPIENAEDTVVAVALQNALDDCDVEKTIEKPPHKEEGTPNNVECYKCQKKGFK